MVILWPEKLEFGPRAPLEDRLPTRPSWDIGDPKNLLGSFQGGRLLKTKGYFPNFSCKSWRVRTYHVIVPWQGSSFSKTDVTWWVSGSRWSTVAPWRSTFNLMIFKIVSGVKTVTSLYYLDGCLKVVRDFCNHNIMLWQAIFRLTWWLFLVFQIFHIWTFPSENFSIKEIFKL